jgi:hypothetical protein
MSSQPPLFDEQVSDNVFQQLSISMTIFSISVRVVSSSIPSPNEQFNSTTLLVGAQYHKHMSSFPPPLDELVNDNFLIWMGSLVATFFQFVRSTFLLSWIITKTL